MAASRSGLLAAPSAQRKSELSARLSRALLTDLAFKDLALAADQRSLTASGGYFTAWRFGHEGIYLPGETLSFVRSGGALYLFNRGVGVSSTKGLT
jgi:hypothetical protein